MLVFGERGKPEYPGKPFRTEYRTNKISPHVKAGSGNRTRAILVEGECSHHCNNLLNAAGIVLWHVITKLKNLSIATEQCSFKVTQGEKEE